MYEKKKKISERIFYERFVATISWNIIYKKTKGRRDPVDLLDFASILLEEPLTPNGGK